MAKLSKEQWQSARRTWESDSRAGFDWLAKKIGVSRPTLSIRATKEGWAKTESTDDTTQQQKATQKATQPIKPKDETELIDVATPILGRPTKYMPSYDRQAYQLCLLGATDAEIAGFFEVEERTVNNWKSMYPNFFQAVKDGKMMADSNVAASLYKRAVGYSYQEVRTKQVVVRPDNEDVDSEMITVEVVTTKKEMPSDPGSAFNWLKNRRPNDWRDKKEVSNTLTFDSGTVDAIRQSQAERLEKARQNQLTVLQGRDFLNEK